MMKFQTLNCLASSFDLTVRWAVGNDSVLPDTVSVLNEKFVVQCV